MGGALIADFMGWVSQSSGCLFGGPYDMDVNIYMGGCQNYGRILNLYYKNRHLILRVPQGIIIFDNHPYWGSTYLGKLPYVEEQSIRKHLDKESAPPSQGSIARCGKLRRSWHLSEPQASYGS